MFYCMKAESANPKIFNVHSIIYDDNYFAIAHGVWTESGENVLAMRWTGEQLDPKDLGYPKVFGHPMWFIVTNDLKNLILTALLNLPLSDTKKIIDILSNKI